MLTLTLITSKELGAINCYNQHIITKTWEVYCCSCHD